MKKTIEATWREGFLDPGALVAPKVNDLYTRKSAHIAARIQRMQRINEIAILIGAPIAWGLHAAFGMPYGGAILCAAWVGLIVLRRQFPHISRFDAPVSADSYQYLKAFQGWLKNRLAWGRRVQRHVYAVTFIALAIAIGESAGGQFLIRAIVENVPDVRLINGVPLILIAGVVVMAIVVDLLGAVIFDLDVNSVYRPIFTRLDQMIAEMEELRGA
jgi:hypothetical protein